QYFEATAGAIAPVYASLLALLLVLVGINMALNVYRIAMRDAVQLSFRIVMVLMFGLSWLNFSEIYDALSNGLGDLALEYFRMGGNGVASSASAAMDDMANMMAGNVDSVSAAMSSIMRGVVAAILYVVLGILMAVYVFIVGFAKLMIAFLLGVAPIAIGATIFEKTKGLFEAWLSAMIGYLMYPVASAGIIVAVVSVARDVFRQSEDVTDLGSILGFFVIVFVGIFALMAIPMAVTHITGQINLGTVAPQALRIAGKPIERSSDYAARRMNEARSGLLTGKTQHHHLRDQARSDAERGHAARLKFSQFIRDG
ncbi:MAG: type IV secretion system protein, partial [Rhodobacteraceae bacterium]|nr:type IV secretion system protein [Paracoccaceae bacterium]